MCEVSSLPKVSVRKLRTRICCRMLEEICHRWHWVFQHDNDSKHTSKVVKGWLSSEDVRVLNSPSLSPDLNLVEDLWDELERQVRKHKHTNKAELFNSLKIEWDKISQDVVNRLIESMACRCAAVIAAKSMPTTY